MAGDELANEALGSDASYKPALAFEISPIEEVSCIIYAYNVPYNRTKKQDIQR